MNPNNQNSKAGAATNINNMNSGKKFSFSINHNKLKEKSKVKPLTREFFGELIKLESDFHNKAYTVETLDELTQYYAVSRVKLSDIQTMSKNIKAI